MPQSYPLYAASLFAGNDFMRSCTAAVFVMVVPYMYNNLRVPKGVSILGSVSVLEGGRDGHSLHVWCKDAST